MVFGLRSLALHSPAAYLASLIKAGSLLPSDYYALESMNIFNYTVPPVHAISGDLSTLSPKDLSARLENHQFEHLLFQSSPANRARLLSVSSRHVTSWLSVIPSVGLNLHLSLHDEFQTALKWWLGIDTSLGSCCSHCPDHQLDHHAMTCKGGGDVVLHHNSLRDVSFRSSDIERIWGDSLK